MCNDLRDNFKLVKYNEVVCWIQDFDSFVREFSKGVYRVPLIDEQNFNKLL